MLVQKHAEQAYMVKPVDYGEFMNTFEELGVFWPIIDRPPPMSGERGP